MPNEPPYHREVAEAEIQSAVAQRSLADTVAVLLKAQRSTAWIARLGLLVAMLSAVAAGWSAWNSYRATENARLSSQGSLLFQMTQTFFYQQPHKKIIRRLEEGQKLRMLTKTAPRILDEDLDDHIGFLDTLGTYVKTNILECKLVEPLFGHYIESTYESQEIQQYIDEVKKSGAADFADFSFIYDKVKNRCAKN